MAGSENGFTEREGASLTTGNRKRQASRSARATSGASLPLALLLFLVCALLASVVLAASTAVSGRHSQLAQADQRYYSAVSAAQLVQGELERQQVVVTCTQEKTVTTQVVYAGNNTSQSSSETVDAVSLSIRTEGSSAGSKRVYRSPDSNILDIDALTLPERMALCMMLGKNMADIEASPAATDDEVWEGALFESFGKVSLGRYTLQPADFTSNTSTVSQEDLQKLLAVALKAEADDNGTVSVVVQPKTAVEQEDVFTLDLTCDSDFDTVEEERTDDLEVTSSATARTETKKVTSVRTTTVQWSGAGMQKGDDE